MKRQGSDESVLMPRQAEVERYRRKITTMMWVVLGFNTLTSAGALFLAFAAIAKPVPVVVYDSEGRPVVFRDAVSAHTRLEENRVRYFAREFLERWVLVDSGNLARDFSRALNMMTPELRELTIRDGSEANRRRTYSQADTMVRSRFDTMELRVSDYGLSDTSADIYVVASGRILYEPLIGEWNANETGASNDNSNDVQQFFVTQIKLKRTPIAVADRETEGENPFGLQVDFASTRMFDSSDDMRVALLKKGV